MCEGQLITILGEIEKGVFAHKNRIRKKIGLSEAEYKGVLCIDAGERISCQEFSRRMGLSVSRGSRVVDRLCMKKYIERVGCESDRRCKNIWLTKKGASVRRSITEELRNIEDILTAGYPEAKLMLLKSDLRHLCGKL